MKMFTGDTQANVGLWLDAQIAADLARVAVLKLAKWTLRGNGGTEAALSEAIVCLRKVWTMAEAISPGEEHFLYGASLAVRAAELDDQLKGLKALQFKTNDIVRIRGALDGERTVQIPGLAPISSERANGKFEPSLYVQVSETALKAEMDGLSEHVSQMKKEHIRQALDATPDRLKAWGARVGVPRAEGFEVVRGDCAGLVGVDALIDILRTQTAPVRSTKALDCLRKIRAEGTFLLSTAS